MAENRLDEQPQHAGAPVARPTIGYLAPAVHEASQPQWLGVVDAAQNRDVNLLCFPGSTLRLSSGFQEQANILYGLVGPANVNGLVSWASSIGNLVTDDESKAFHERYDPLPVVTIGKAWEGMPSVSMESYQGMREVVTHLIQVHQCRRLAFIRGPEGHPQAQARYRAYIDALEAHDLSGDPDLVSPPGGWGGDPGEQAMRLLLDERRLRPRVDLDAVVAASDDLLLGALQILRARGIQIPEDLAVAGFDNIRQGQVAMLPLTTVAAPFHELGRRSIDTILDVLGGQSVAPTILAPSRMVIRQSCGCLDSMVAQARLGSVETGHEGPAETGHETIALVLASWRAEIVIKVMQALMRPVMLSAAGWSSFSQSQQRN